MTAGCQNRLVLGTLLAFWITAPNAQLTGGVQVGAVTVYPDLGVSIGYDDNVALGSDGIDDRIESFFLILSPALRMEAGSKKSLFSFEVGADFAEYEATSFDDYNDFKALGGWEYTPTTRSSLNVAARYLEGHTRRGEGVRDFLLDETLNRDVDEYVQKAVDGRYSFGASGARGHLDFSLGLSDLEYENNLELTEIGNNEAGRFGFRFTSRVAPKTSLMALARYADFDFDVSDRDNHEVFYGGGVEWEATAKTSGRFEIGYLDKSFDDPDSPGYSGSSWDASVDWKFKDYSVFQFGTGRTASEAFGESNFLVRDYFEVAWRHRWRARLATTVDFGISHEDQDPGTREDDFWSVGASANYEFRRWMLVGLGLKHTERDSTDAGADYDRNELILSLEFRL